MTVTAVKVTFSSLCTGILRQVKKAVNNKGGILAVSEFFGFFFFQKKICYDMLNFSKSKKLETYKIDLCSWFL